MTPSAVQIVSIPHTDFIVIDDINVNIICMGTESFSALSLIMFCSRKAEAFTKMK